MTTSTIVHARWIAPVVPQGTLLADHALLIEGGKIADLGPQAEVRARHPNAEQVTLDSHLLIPGLVNCHTHAAMTLLRGVADDLDMLVWLRQAIWPLEAKHASAEFVYDGTRLAAAEMIRTGTTCCADSYFFPDSAARAFMEMGVRAQIGAPVINASNAWARDEEDHIHKALGFHDEVRGAPLITHAFAPHAPYTLSDKGFKRVAMYAEQLDLPVHLHLHETAEEVSEGVAEHGARPIERMRALGLVNPSLQAVHMTTLADAEIELMATNGCHVAHCPESNLKLASGICPVSKLLAEGVNVALGTDGAASNNDLDMLGEMRTAALLAKGTSGDATTLDAHAALEMATLSGARLLGLDREIGSIEIGKAADLAAVDLSDFTFEPLHNPVSQLVYQANGQHVSDVWVNGEPRLRDRTLTGGNIEDIVTQAAKWRQRMVQA